MSAPLNDLTLLATGSVRDRRLSHHQRMMKRLLEEDDYDEMIRELGLDEDLGLNDNRT